MDCSLKIQSGIQWSECGKVIEKDAVKLFWDWVHPVKRDGIAGGPDLTLEDTSNKLILLIDMASPNVNNKIAKRDGKIGKYHWLCIKLREGLGGYTVKVIPAITGCLWGEIKKLEESIRQMFQCDNDDKELESISREVQKTVLWESESLVKKNLIWTVDMMYSNLTNKFL